MVERASSSARSGSAGLGPQHRGHRAPRAICSDAAAMGRSNAERSPARLRQSGNPGPEGRPAAKTARRSGGNANPISASARASSASVSPGSTATPDARRWASTAAAREPNECSPCRGEAKADEGPAAARVDRRRSPAACAAGVRPAIRWSTSTIATDEPPQPPSFLGALPA
uniref:Uncharacterized protein n=1 Tax=Arundo donax TaxID=35708 RepID=A0A0A8ZMV7_ARUDO